MSAPTRDRFLFYLTIAFLLALLLIYCNRPEPLKRQPAELQTAPVVPAANTNDTLTVAARPPEFRFEFVMDSVQYGDVKFNNVEYGDSIKLIHIYRTSDGKKIQTLNPGPNMSMTHMDKIRATRFTVEDMNFDGHDDFRIVTWIYMRGQTMFSFWIYNLGKEKFEEDTNLAKTADVIFYPESKTVYSCMRHGCCYEHESELYTWENGVLVSQREEEVMMDFYDTTNNRVYLTIRQRVNGKMKERSFHLPGITEEWMDFSDKGWCFRETSIEKFEPPPGSVEL
jgi:hypothetical protein